MELLRTEGLTKFRNEQTILRMDDPDYKYLFIGDWTDMQEDPKEFGWLVDSIGIFVNKNLVGWAEWKVDRNNVLISAVDIFIAKDYLSFGYGAKALVLLVKYLLVDRGFRKINFSCCLENAPAIKMYRKLCKLAGREVGTKKAHLKLRDGKFHDLVLFEIMKEDLCNTRVDDFLSALE